MTRPLYDTPRHALDPPCMTDHAGAVLTDLRDTWEVATYDDPNDPQVGDLHQRFGEWVLATRGPVKVQLALEKALGAEVRVQHRPTGLPGRTRRVWEWKQPGQGWLPIGPRVAWFLFHREAAWADEFINQRLADELQARHEDDGYPD